MCYKDTRNTFIYKIAKFNKLLAKYNLKKHGLFYSRLLWL